MEKYQKTPISRTFPALKVAAMVAALAVVVPAGFRLAPSHGSGLLAHASELSERNVFVPLAKRTVPSVVNISTLSTIKTPNGYGTPDDMFRRFFEEFFRNHGRSDNGDNGDNGDNNNDNGGDDDNGSDQGTNTQRAPKAMSLGSGFIVDASGLILTNNHVVAGADEIKIYFTEDLDEKPTDGEVVGRDPEIDVALIRVKTQRKLVPLPLGDSDSLQVGEYVMAVGNPFGQGHSVTHGIISAKGRYAPDFPLARYLQTDAPINPGNSGGPLVNLSGEVIGINNAIEARAQGIGFAIPINLVKGVLKQLETKGKVSRGFIGVLVEPLTPEIAPKLGASANLEAPFVSQINPGEPAAQAGLKVYDVILTFNGKPIHTGDDLVAAVTSAPVGASVPIEILRNGKQKTLTLTIAQRPTSDWLAKQQEVHPKKGHKLKPKVNVGMEVETLTPELAQELDMPENSKGVVVDSTAYNGPADQAGLMRGDVILEADRKPVRNEKAFYSIVKEKKSYLLRVRRTDQEGHESFSVIILDLKGS